MLKNTDGCTIALPEGKNLGKPTLDLFRAARINVVRASERSIEARIEGMPGITRAVFCRPEQVPGLVARGDVMCGITGKDMILERPDERIKVFTELEYSRNTLGGTRLQIFTNTENPVSTLSELRKDRDTNRGLGELAVVSEYPLETRAFLKREGIDLKVVPTPSAEVMVYIGRYRYGAVLVETGTTLAVNNLKSIKDGVIFESCAVLIGNQGSYLRWAGAEKPEPRSQVIPFLGALLKGTLEARKTVYLVMNVEKRDLETVKKMLPALKSPTIQPLADSSAYSVASVVPSDTVNEIILKLRTIGGVSGFVVLPPSTVMKW